MARADRRGGARLHLRAGRPDPVLHGRPAAASRRAHRRRIRRGARGADPRDGAQEPLQARHAAHRQGEPADDRPRLPLSARLGGRLNELAVEETGSELSPQGSLRPDEGLRSALGYLLALAGAALYGIGGVIAKDAFKAGIEPSELAELRALFSFLVLLVVLAIFARRHLRVRRADLPILALFGALGIAAVNGAYYETIQRLPLGVALAIQYTAPLLLLVIARALGRHVGGRLWIAAAITLVGCYFVVGAYDASLREVNALGTAWALVAMLTFAAYFLIAERVVRRYTPWTLLFWGLFFASAAWAVYRVPTRLPWELAATQWPLIVGIVFVATLIPYVLTLGAVSLLPAARVGLTSTFEPVVGAVAGFVFLGEVLQPPQLVGGALVLLGIALVQTVRLRAGGA
ncbi:MAG: EamA family transporter [Chloroflexota bacterium]|nr:EamA family transporter [Chloroflexota bacterium]